MYYRLKCALERVVQGKTHVSREFDVVSDEKAIEKTEEEKDRFRHYDPETNSYVKTSPSELIEMTEPPRTVKTWEK